MEKGHDTCRKIVKEEYFTFVTHSHGPRLIVTRKSFDCEVRLSSNKDIISISQKKKKKNLYGVMKLYLTEICFRHGATDEMCNFHIHYSYPAGSNDLVRHVECAWDAETFHWEDHFPSIPLNSSNTEDSDQTFYIKKYHWTHHNYK